MTDAMEKSLWSRQKQPIIQGFIDERKKLVSTVAGRGFLLAPGFLYEFETGLEIDAKQKLSEISYKILSEAIERDIKQSGLDYDALYKNAVMAWEIRKQGLLAAWDRELILLKQRQSIQDEDLLRLAITVSLLGITLLNAKNAIELEAEGLRKSLADLEGGASDYEIQLAQQKLATANRKLDVIPVMQQILAVEEAIVLKQYDIAAKDQLVVEKEAEKVGYTAGLVTAESLVVWKYGSEVLPATQSLLGVSQRLVSAIRAQTSNETQILAQKVLDAGIAVQKAEKQIVITTTAADESSVRLSLATARADLAEAQREYETALLRVTNNNLTSMTDLEQQAHYDVMEQEQTTQSTVNNLREETVKLKLERDVFAAEETATSVVDVTLGIADLAASERMTIAELQAMSDIAAELKHIIG